MSKNARLRPHCWHEDGRRCDLPGGDCRTAEGVTCCQCGRLSFRRFCLVPLEGHGPHFPAQREVRWIDADKITCEPKPGK